jgi:hypothetical protein
VDLDNLTDDAGAALLHHAGANRAGVAEIKSDDKELFAASREVDGHALTLNLLGRFLARAHGGDIRRRDLVKFEEADRKEQGGTTFKMLAAFESWFANEGDIEARALTILRMLGLFDRPADEGCMATLREPPAVAGLTESLFTRKRGSSSGDTTERPLSDKAWNDATHFLKDFGLISTLNPSTGSTSAHSLDCHPLIREHFAKQVRAIEGNGWCMANIRLFSYLAKSVPQWPDDLRGLEPLYQAVFHGCQAGLYEYALAILKYRIMHQPDGKVSLSGGRTFSTDGLGAVHQDLVALANLFEKPWSVVAPSLSDSVKGWVLNQTSFRLRDLGRISEACEPICLGLEFTTSSQDNENAMCDAVNLSELEALSGNMDKAIRLAEVAMNLAKSMSNNPAAKTWSICAHARKARALHLCGRLQAAESEFVLAEKNQNEFDPRYPLLYGLSGCQYAELLLAADERLAWSNYALPSIPRSIEGGMKCLAVRRRMETIVRWLADDEQILQICFTIISWARARMYATCFNVGFFSTDDVLAEVRVELEPALQKIRTLHTAEFLVEGLVLRSLLLHMTRDSHSARLDLDEAWDIASRGPMRLHMADIHLYRARLFFREKPYPWKSPQDDLAAAEKLINECGYHRRDEELADSKRAILGS